MGEGGGAIVLETEEHAKKEVQRSSAVSRDTATTLTHIM